MTPHVLEVGWDLAGPAMCAPGLPHCWADDGGMLGFGHDDGVLLVGPEKAVWFPLPDVVALDATGGGWLALTEDPVDGAATAWELCADGPQLRARVPGGVHGLRLEGGSLIERRGFSSRVARLVGRAQAVELPLGAARGRVAVGPDGVAWADGPDLYRRDDAGRARTAGQAAGPVTRLQRGPGGMLLATIANRSTLVVPPRGRTWSIAHASADPAVLGVAGALLQVGDDVLSVPWDGAAETWLRNRELCGSARVVLDPEEGRVHALDGTTLLGDLLPCAATATDAEVLGPAGRAWPRAGGPPGPFEPGLLAEHLVAHEGHVMAVLDGHARVRSPGAGFGPPGQLPAPFDDPDELIALRPARGGVVLVGDDERVFRSWAGQVRRGMLPKSRRAPRSPDGWHWNDAGLLLRLA